MMMMMRPNIYFLYWEKPTWHNIRDPTQQYIRLGKGIETFAGCKHSLSFTKQRLKGMASLSASASASLLGFRSPSGSGRAQISTTDVLNLKQFASKVSPIPSCFRFKNTARLQKRQRLVVASASNSIPSGDSNKEKSSGIKTSDAPQRPPFLTVLAGFLVFLLVSWIVGSIILWLIGIIVKVPPSK
nr:uncharacterized protein LOC112028088 [Quercus suber]